MSPPERVLLMLQEMDISEPCPTDLYGKYLQPPYLEHLKRPTCGLPVAKLRIQLPLRRVERILWWQLYQVVSQHLLQAALFWGLQPVATKPFAAEHLPQTLP